MPQDFFKNKESFINWSVIEDYEKENTIASWSMALAELYKLLNFVLEDQGYSALEVEAKIKKAKIRFSDLKSLMGAIKIHDKIFKKNLESVNLLEIKEAEKNLKKAVKDLVNGSNFVPPSLIERMKASWDYYCVDKEKIYKNIFWFLFLIILIFVLDNTHFGQTFIHFLVSFFSSVLSWLILTGLILMVLVILILGTLFFIGRGKK